MVYGHRCNPGPKRVCATLLLHLLPTLPMPNLQSDRLVREDTHYPLPIVLFPYTFRCPSFNPYNARLCPHHPSVPSHPTQLLVLYPLITTYPPAHHTSISIHTYSTHPPSSSTSSLVVTLTHTYTLVMRSDGDVKDEIKWRCDACVCQERLSPLC